MITDSCHGGNGHFHADIITNPDVCPELLVVNFHRYIAENSTTDSSNRFLKPATAFTSSERQ
jgi:hypothetical protein